MITKERFERLYSDDITKREYDEIIGEIDERFGEICKKFLRYMDQRRGWFDYGNCDYESENSGGYFDPKEYRKYIAIGGEYVNPPDGYDSCPVEIPTRWLWEDFEAEMHRVVDKAKRDKMDEKQRQKEYREERKKMIETLKVSIKSKLTPQEWKIIKFKK